MCDEQAHRTLHASEQDESPTASEIVDGNDRWVRTSLLMKARVSGMRTDGAAEAEKARAKLA